MLNLYRLYFHDIDGHLVYVAQTKNISQILPSFYQFASFATDVDSAAAFDKESCLLVKGLLEEYYASMMDKPIYLITDRVL